MKFFIAVLLFFVILFPQQVFADTTIVNHTGNASATSDVETSVEGSSTTTTHIETTVNGHTTTFDSTSPGIYHVVSTDNGTTITSIPDEGTPTATISPIKLPTPLLHPKIFHNQTFFSKIKSWIFKLLHSL